MKKPMKKMASKVRGYADGVSDVGETEWDREENNAQLSHRIPISEANSQAFQDAAKAKLQKMGGGVSGYAKGTSKVAKKVRGYADGTGDVTPMDRLTDPDGEQTLLRPGMSLSDARSTGASIGKALSQRAIQQGHDAYKSSVDNGPHYAKGTSKVPSKPRESKVDKVVNRLFKK